MKKQKIKVAFTQSQHAKVHAFLDMMRASGVVEKELGAPVKVVVDWSPAKEGEIAAVHFTGSLGLTKSIPLTKILEADDSNLPAPVARPKLHVVGAFSQWLQCRGKIGRTERT